MKKNKSETFNDRVKEFQKNNKEYFSEIGYGFDKIKLLYIVYLFKNFNSTDWIINFKEFVQNEEHQFELCDKNKFHFIGSATEYSDLESEEEKIERKKDSYLFFNIPNQTFINNYELIKFIDQSMKVFAKYKEDNILSNYLVNFMSEFNFQEEQDINNDLHFIFICEDEETPSIILENFEKTKKIYQKINIEVVSQNDLLDKDNQCKSNAYPFVSSRCEISLDKKENYCVNKDNDLYIGYSLNIYASDIRRLYKDFSRLGLFGANVRYYIKNKTIDAKIRNSILNDQDEFWFRNNGISMVCLKTKIADRKVSIDRFSIVNGGQTTYLIGETWKESMKDFKVPLRIIEVILPENDYKKICNSTFIANDPTVNKIIDTCIEKFSTIAECLNSQKPIKGWDKITNQPEVLSLKNFYKKLFRSKDDNIILTTKSGEEKWLFAGLKKESWINLQTYFQLLACFIYQAPGTAKSSKSSLVSANWLSVFTNKNIYEKLGSEFTRWINDLWTLIKSQSGKIVRGFKNNIKLEKFDSEQAEILKVGKHYILSLVGFVYQYVYNYNIQDINAEDFLTKTSKPPQQNIFFKNISQLEFDMSHLKTLSSSNVYNFLIWVSGYLRDLLKQSLQLTTIANISKKDDDYWETILHKTTKSLKKNKDNILMHFSSLIDVNN